MRLIIITLVLGSVATVPTTSFLPNKLDFLQSTKLNTGLLSTLAEEEGGEVRIVGRVERYSHAKIGGKDAATVPRDSADAPPTVLTILPRFALNRVMTLKAYNFIWN